MEKIAGLAPLLSPPFKVAGTAPSRLLGPKGNQEVFVLMERDGNSPGLREGPVLEGSGPEDRGPEGPGQ